jgi:hypothetical protein
MSFKFKFTDDLFHLEKGLQNAMERLRVGAIAGAIFPRSMRVACPQFQAKLGCNKKVAHYFDEFFWVASKNNLKIERVDFSEIKLATGGIVESPTRALIGEAGPEAVVPLNSDKSMNVFSKSLEDKLDRLIAAVEKGGVVMLDGQKVGEALVVNSYRVQ